MKALKVVKNIVVMLLVVVYFVFVLAMTVLLLYRDNQNGVTKIDDTSLIIIDEDISRLSRDESEEPQYKKGDLVLVKDTRLEDIKEGEELFTYRLLEDETTGRKTITVDLGNVGTIHEREQEISFENGNTYSMEFVIGKADSTHANWGTFLSVILSQWGFLFIVLVPSFLIFVYQLYALIIEIKYNKEATAK